MGEARICTKSFMSLIGFMILVGGRKKDEKKILTIAERGNVAEAEQVRICGHEREAENLRCCS